MEGFGLRLGGDGEPLPERRLKGRGEELREVRTVRETSRFWKCESVPRGITSITLSGREAKFGTVKKETGAVAGPRSGLLADGSIDGVDQYMSS
ncbi:hypothetical protein VT85_02895 [Planctomyces sp. SH-PL62]|nr:hypothetical protein VT85_02895 [Planctomyces sp. SH-PL62]